jgi:hypothetical protein
MRMYDGMQIYKAMVVNSSPSTGFVDVKIPSILGPSESVALSTTTLSNSGGSWAVPAVGTQVLVAVEDQTLSNVYLVGSGGGGGSGLDGVTISDSVLQSPEERWTVFASAVPTSLDIDVATSAAVYYSVNATSNWSINVRGDSSTPLGDVLAIGDSITVVLAVKNGSTAYFSSSITIDTSITPTVMWQGGTTPTSGNTNSVDFYAMSILRTDTSEFTVFVSQTKFA